MTVKELEAARMLDVAKISTNGNARKRFNEARLKELTESVKKVGVLEPILVRRAGDGYPLIAGERRLRAAKSAGLKQVPVRVLDVDENTALEIQALENLHREDLTPIEEARAFKVLMEQSGWQVKDLALKMDKSEAYVYRAVRLLELPASVIDAIDEGKLTQAHGHQLLRVQGKKRQEDLARTAVKRGDPVRDLKNAIDEHEGRNLSEAKWPKDEPYASQQACSKCPYNSGNQGDLFDGVEKGRCTKPGCYGAKLEAWTKEQARAVMDKHDGATFLGVVKMAYEAERLAKGGIALNGWGRKLSEEAQKAIEREPSKFAIALERENDGTLKTLYVARSPSLGRKLMRQRQASSTTAKSSNAERSSRIKAVSGLVDAAVRKVCWESVQPSTKQLLQWVVQDHEIDAICQILQLHIADVEAWPAEKLLKLLWFKRAAGLTKYDDSFMEKWLKVDRKVIEKRIKDEAAKVWLKSQSPACCVCGCTPMKACKMRKGSYGGCWWVRPGICSACQDKPVPEKVVAKAVKKAAKKRT